MQLVGGGVVGIQDVEDVGKQVVGIYYIALLHSQEKRMVGLLETHQVEVGTLTGIEQCELGKLNEQGFRVKGTGTPEP